MNSDNKCAIFDVCGTLFDSNTTFDFVRFYNKESFFIKILSSPFIKYFIVLLGRLIRFDIYRSLFILSLRGVSRDVLLDAALTFYEKSLSSKIIPETIELLENYKLQSDCNVVLCSASLDFIVEVIGDKLGVGFISSSLRYSSEGICLGYFASDILGCKEKFFIGKELELVVTDNQSDLALVKLSKQAFIVAKSKNVDFWQSNNFGVDLII